MAAGEKKKIAPPVKKEKITGALENKAERVIPWQQAKPDIKIVVQNRDNTPAIPLAVDLQTELDRRATALYAADLPADAPEPGKESENPDTASKLKIAETSSEKTENPESCKSPEKQPPADPKKEQWEYLVKHFPVMRYQDRNGGVIFSIRLGSRDLNRVPRDKWELGNNSFLLHGFYQYKHLLLLRRETEDYIGYYLGVPGVYNEREQMLASMFGFEEFRLMKGQETRDGSFGYWCRILR